MEVGQYIIITRTNSVSFFWHADYNFLYADVGTNGRANDSGVLGRSDVTRLIENGNLNIPPPQPLTGRNADVPFVIVGDEAFPLKEYLVKPYPSRQLDQDKRIFNNRLSRARRIVENVFGILASRFGIFQRALSFDPDKVTAFVLASCALHNLLRSKTSSRKIYTPEGMFDNDDDLGELRTASRDSCFVNLVLQGGNRNNTLIQMVR